MTRLLDVYDKDEEDRINSILVKIMALYKEIGYYDQGDGESGDVYMISIVKGDDPGIAFWPYDPDRDSITRTLTFAADNNSQENVASFLSLAREVFAGEVGMVERETPPHGGQLLLIDWGHTAYTGRCELFSDGRVEYRIGCQAFNPHTKKYEAREKVVQWE